MQQDKNDQAITSGPALNDKTSSNLVIPESLGERFNRLLIIIMEVCLVYALLLVQAGFSRSGAGPLLPLWAIFLLFLAFYWLSRGLNPAAHLRTSVPLPLPLHKVLAKCVMGCAVLVGLMFCTWLHLYAQRYALFDPTWFQALSNDLGQLDSDTQIAAFAVILCVIVWLSRLTIVEAEANGAILLHKGGMFLAILAGVSLIESWFGSNPDYWQTFLLLPVFFWSGLTIQALQKASKKRRYHAVGLEGNTRYQERIIFQMMLLLGLVILGTAIAIMKTHGVVLPLVSRMSAAPALPSSAKPILPASDSASMPSQKMNSNPVFQHIFTSALGIILSIGVGILILGLIATGLFLWSTLRKKRAKKVKQDEAESLWSWSLFLAQLRALLLSFFSFLRPLRDRLRASQDQGAGKSQFSAPEIHTIREIYRAFLYKAEQRGYERKQAETPNEFHARLHTQEPLVDPELGIITEAYALARYGGADLRDGELIRVKEIWRDLEHKW